jgi:hypothetical protein
MKMPGSLLTRVILYLIILAVGTFVIFIALEIAAIPISSVQTYLSCPQETTIKYTWVQESWDQPGEKTMEKTCLDNNGKQQEGFSDAVYFQRENNLFMPIGFASMFVIEVSWIIAHSIKKS